MAHEHHLLLVAMFSHIRLLMSGECKWPEVTWPGGGLSASWSVITLSCPLWCKLSLLNGHFLTFSGKLGTDHGLVLQSTFESHCASAVLLILPWKNHANVWHSRTLLRIRDVCGLYFERGRWGCFVICDSFLPIPISGLFWDISSCSFLMI